MSQEKIFQFRRRFDSLYWQQFLLTAGMVLLTLLLLGVSFYGLSYNDTVAERRSEMRQHAELIANMSGDYLASDGQTQSPSLQNLVALAAGLTKADFLICNQEGYALLTSDQRLGGKVVSVPQDIQDAVLGDQGFYQGRSSIGGAYDLKQFVVGVPVTQEDGSTVGMVLAVMDARSLMSMWRSFIGLFFMTSAIILLISFVASSLTSMRQIQPIREMARATRAYAAGNFDVRMQDTGRNDEIGELVSTINDMSVKIGQAEKTQTEFISSVSHELRTPLTAISGWGETLLTSENLDAETRRGVVIIAREAKRLTGMVEELLEFTRMQDGRFTLHVETADILAEFEDTVFMYGSRLRQEGICLHYDGCDEDIPEIPCDVARMRQVFLNILDNAAKHGGEGKRIDASIAHEGGYVVIRIRDYGPGIPEEELPRVKLKFYKGSSKARGSGIGLAVCEEIVTMHGGTLTLENAEGGGTLVTISIPTGEE